MSLFTPCMSLGTYVGCRSDILLVPEQKKSLSYAFTPHQDLQVLELGVFRAKPTPRPQGNSSSPLACLPQVMLAVGSD